jgi:hypothetical protein
MKLNKLTKGLVAAAALTTAGFANAGAVGSAIFDISNFSVINVDEGVVQDGIIITSNEFLGSLATTFDGVTDNYQVGVDYDPGTDLFPDFTLTSNDSNSSATSDFSGVATVQGGASGLTDAYSYLEGNGSATSRAVLENTANFTFLGTDDDVANEVANVAIAFEMIWDIVADSFGQGGTAEAGIGLSINLFDLSTGLNIFNFSMEEVTTDLVQNDNNSAQYDVNDPADNGQDAVLMAGASYYSPLNLVQSGFAPVELREGTQYQLLVSQSSYVDLTSVPEPTSLAVFGLGLLGLAGAARRRKA